MSAPGVDALADLPGRELAALALVGGGVLAVIGTALLVVWSIPQLVAYTVTVAIVAIVLKDWWGGRE
jgi:hypothetical protein